MKLYLIERADNVDVDEYTRAVVCANKRSEALQMTPDEVNETKPTYWTAENLKIRCIGEAARGLRAGVVMSEFYGV